LVLNGNGSGPINNVAFLSRISPKYAPPEKALISVVVLGNAGAADEGLVDAVHTQLIDWFGHAARRWRHLRTYQIAHALPKQSPPTHSPYQANSVLGPGLFRCGESGSLPGIQWAMLSGRRAAESVQAYLR
jgi:hypothetical protein